MPIGLPFQASGVQQTPAAFCQHRMLSIQLMPGPYRSGSSCQHRVLNHSVGPALCFSVICTMSLLTVLQCFLRCNCYQLSYYSVACNNVLHYGALLSAASSCGGLLHSTQLQIRIFDIRSVTATSAHPCFETQHARLVNQAALVLKKRKTLQEVRASAARC
jgi:hypothetical protein